MDVHHLDEGHQGEQQHTDERSGAHNPGVGAATSVSSMFADWFHPIHADITRIHRFKHWGADFAV
jgi:hypothetical protein